ncbi:MAG: 2,3-bisphosphoglycerate-independent phosphoglycerate mutase [Candidatus Aenigmarchaeota archaeon]|nr:2,3-bisphosphoglycerate-independent phosphoglycerate mutase [Candidatus Aenigmarchaeota archaeon]
MKYVLVLLDGGGDRPDANGNTPLSLANKPNIDMLAANGMVGLLDIGYGKDVDSDFGFFTILGYAKDEYPGRGYLEALGANLQPKDDAICIRGNFATLDGNGVLIDRRAGRDNTGLESLVEAVDGMEIDGITFRIVKSAGHRVVMVLEDRRLTDGVLSNDPRVVNVPLPEVKPKDDAGKFTASLLNKFVRKAHQVLQKHAVNAKRECPANVILIRSVGKKRPVQSFQERFGLTGCCIAGIPIADGVARYLGMDVIKLPGSTGYPDTNWDAKVAAAITALGKYDLVWLHINALDILAHDKKRVEKTAYVKKIDDGIGRIIKAAGKDTAYILVPDHKTVSLPDFGKYEHVADPVPVCISGPGIKPNGVGKYDEQSAERGFKLEKHALLGFVLSLARHGGQ